MPVIEYAVHEKTIAEPHYGCHNKPRPKIGGGYWAPDRIYRPDGTYYNKRKFIKNVLSKECRHDKSLSDPRCCGCNHIGSGEKYVTAMTEAAGNSPAKLQALLDTIQAEETARNQLTK